MLKFNRYLFLVGVILTIMGTVVGLSVLVLGHEGWGKFLITFAPFGMLIMFTALVVLVMHEPRQGERRGNGKVQAPNQSRYYHENRMPD